MPRDFDISPYLVVVKPTLESGFGYRALAWAQEPNPARQQLAAAE